MRKTLLPHNFQMLKMSRMGIKLAEFLLRINSDLEKVLSAFFGGNTKIFTTFLFIATLFISSLVWLASSTAAVSQTMNVQGKVTNANGTNVADGVYNFVFKLYDGAGASANNTFTENWTSTTLWTSTMSTAPSAGGTSLVYSSNTNEASIKAGQILWNTTKKEPVTVVSVNTGANTITISATRQAWNTSDSITNRIYVQDGIF